MPVPRRGLRFPSAFVFVILHLEIFHIIVVVVILWTITNYKLFYFQHVFIDWLSMDKDHWLCLMDQNQWQILDIPELIDTSQVSPTIFFCACDVNSSYNLCILLWIHFWSLNVNFYGSHWFKQTTKLTHNDSISDKTTKSNLNEYLSFCQSLKIDSNENKWNSFNYICDHCILFSSFHIYSYNYSKVLLK